MHSRQDGSVASPGEDDFEKGYWRRAPEAPRPLPALSPGAIADDEFRLLAENIPTLCWMANGDGYIVWYNRRWHDYCGTTPEAMEGWGWQSVHDPDLLPQVMERWTASVATGEPFEMTFPLKGADGVFRPFLTRIQPVRDSSGGIVRWFGVNTEISAQIAAERALRASDARQEALFAEQAAILGQLAEGVIVTDQAGKITFVNEAAEGLHGVKQLDVAPDDYSETYHLLTEAGEPYPPHELPLARAVLHGETIIDARWRIARPDGSEVLAIGSASPVLDAARAQTGAVLTLRDDTQRRKAEQALRKSEERLQFALAASGTVGTWDWDVVNDLVYADARFAELYSVDPVRAAAGAPITEFVAGIHPDDRAKAGAAIDAAMTTGEPFAAEYRLRQPDGSVRWVLARGRCHRDAFGKPLRFPGASIDISDRKIAETALRESEARYRILTEVSPQTVWMARADGYITYCNPHWYEYTGFTPEQTEGQGWTDAIHPDERERLRAAWLHAAPTGSEWNVEIPFRRAADGAYRWHLAKGSPVRDEAGEITGWMGIAVDIHVRRKAEEALQDINETLERRVSEVVAEREHAEEALRQSQKMEAVGQLTGGIAHDFNNLLTVVIGNIDMGRRSLEASGGDARTRRALDNALKGAERAASLTQRLLAFARRQPLAPKPLDVDKLVLGMSELLNRALGETIKLEIVTSPGLWRVEADPNQLESAILNLAVNARDAMPEGGRLSVATENASLTEAYSAAHAEVAPGNYIVITVGDTGEGMSRATLARVFEPFFTTKEVGKGTGLGLSQVYGFVKQSGGHVALYSEEGQGTTVKIYLPRLIAEDGEEEDAPEAEIEASQAEETLLVVEDDDDVRAYTVALLREIGYRVLEAHDGASALRLLEREHARIDLLFTDVVMPGMSGRELADAARAQQPNLKVLYTSGYTKDAIVDGGRLEPGIDLVAKPFTYQTLARKVRDMLDTGRSGRTLVVDGDAGRHASTATMLGEAGYAVDRSDTVGEAMGRVRANGGRYDFIIIDADLAEQGAEALATQLRALHCDLPLLLVAGKNAKALRSRFALDRCIDVLAKPYTAEELQSSLAILGVECAGQSEPPTGSS